MNFGKKLKALRESKGLGVNQLALKSGVSASNISRLEKGERKDPTLETVKKLSKALGVSISYFEDEATHPADRIAAHIDENIVAEQLEDIINYIEFVKQKNVKPKE
ncbi:helix-turn-helix transcriptional regulator [Enterococcus sp. 669A]|uniref:Helix-turn-helix transcriptional regulator n=1 Tax=Candidatus Enterococcus moelleringii TaxID=2815325 RepID=A0ABS3LDM4_9ENTE|nr:helix-turn-helix transcriptional regulator [Enterococcus sp. 669A]MBO1307733.1 helix-turn-helix transcriptional regulator [Enterococcus sp. 669A]